MEIIKSHKNPSKVIERPSDIADVIGEFITFFDEHDGKFNGHYPKAFGLHHSQVTEDPYNFFVVTKDLVGDVPATPKNRNHNNESFYFPARTILNPEILETPEKIKMKVPKRELEKVKDPEGKTVMTTKIVVTEQDVPNTHKPEEGCISFPHRKAKHKERYYRIKVKYQYFNDKGSLKKKEEWIEGLKSHIFQHEVEHGLGKNMYFDK